MSIPQAALQQSRLQVQASEQPILEQIAQERAANAAKAQAQIGFAKAAAAIMQQAAPAVGDAYTNAANADASYARGLGTGVQQTLDQNQTADNSFLTQMGTPSSALKAAPAVGDVSYGLQGYIPATSLQREGAGFESAAQLAPGNLLNAGQQQAQQILQNDPQLVTLQNQLATLAAKQPAVYQSLLTAFQDQADKQQQLALSRASLQQRAAYENASLKARAQYENATLNLRQQGLALTRQKDKAALQAAARKGQAPDPSLSRIYGYVVDSNGDPIPNKQGGKIPIKSTSTSTKSSKNGGFTPDELVHIKGEAGRIAYDSFYGNPKTKTKPVPYGKALQILTLDGIPRKIAIQALRNVGYLPGVKGTPTPSGLFSGLSGLTFPGTP